MKTLLQWMVLGAALTALASCGTDEEDGVSGIRLTDQQLCQLKEGETTYGQAIDALDQPNTQTVNAEGQTLIWTYVEISDGKKKTERVTLLFKMSTLVNIKITGREVPACLRADGG